DDELTIVRQRERLRVVLHAGQSQPKQGQKHKRSEQQHHYRRERRGPVEDAPVGKRAEARKRCTRRACAGVARGREGLRRKPRHLPGFPILASMPRATPATRRLVAKERGVTLLDFRDLRKYGGRIVGQQLDVLERRAVRRLLYVRMYRAQAALVDEQLLTLRAVKKVLQHARRVGMRRVGEYRRRRGDEGRALLRIDDLHRALRLDLDEHVVLVAVDHD